MRELVADAAIVFHLAARNIIACTANPRDDYSTNIGGTLNVLLAARETRPERVVYTSSTSVYGNPRSIPINEDDGIVLLSPYAVSKLAGEHYCLAFYESYGVAVAVSGTPTSTDRANGPTTPTAASSPSSWPQRTPANR